MHLTLFQNIPIRNRDHAEWGYSGRLAIWLMSSSWRPDDWVITCALVISHSPRFICCHVIRRQVFSSFRGVEESFPLDSWSNFCRTSLKVWEIEEKFQDLCPLRAEYSLYDLEQEKNWFEKKKNTRRIVLNINFTPVGLLDGQQLSSLCRETPSFCLPGHLATISFLLTSFSWPNLRVEFSMCTLRRPLDVLGVSPKQFSQPWIIHQILFQRSSYSN